MATTGSTNSRPQAGTPNNSPAALPADPRYAIAHYCEGDFAVEVFPNLEAAAEGLRQLRVDHAATDTPTDTRAAEGAPCIWPEVGQSADDAPSPRRFRRALTRLRRVGRP
jgi:hypothetical protein